MRPVGSPTVDVVPREAVEAFMEACGIGRAFPLSAHISPSAVTIAYVVSPVKGKLFPLVVTLPVESPWQINT